MADESVEDDGAQVNTIIPSQKGADVKKSKRVCRFYAKSGRCKFEEKCRFVHVNKGSADAGRTTVSTRDSTKKQRTVCTQESQQQQIDTEETNEQIKEDIAQPSMRVTVGEKEPQNNISTQDDQNTKTITKKRCRYFNSRGGCDRGDACKFYHAKPKTHRKKTCEEIESQEKTKENNVEATCVQDRPQAKKAISTSEKLSSIDAEQLNNLRTRELGQLVRRFGKKRLTEVQDSSGTTYNINFAPSDPDWPFDIENILLSVTFPNDYPKKMFAAGLSQDQALPLELTSVVNQGIIKWIQQQQETRNKKDTVDLPFRSFLRWLDRNVERLFIDAAKKMKEKEEHVVNEDQTSEIEECIENSEVKNKSEEGFAASDVENADPNPKKQERQQKQYDSHSHSSTERKEILLSDFLTFKSKPSKLKVAGNTKAGHHGNSTQNTKTEHIVFVDDPIMEKPHGRGAECNDIVSDDAGEAIVVDGVHVSWGDAVSDDARQNGNEKPRGTEIRFRGLELFENTSTLRTESIALTMECDKCKTKIDTKAEKSRATAMRCARCTSVVQVGFRPSIVHQYSTSTIGYLDVQGWHPFDLIMTDTCLIVGCLACSHETPVKGPQYGLNQVWCSKCHQKLQFQIESTRFFQLMPTCVLSDKCDVPLAAPKKKAPGLRAGLPLPDNGTCKHYKKSYRWLRFPCCGKCYPCDVCHDEEECHEMKYATRMVCGFCSKEQPFSQGNCTACNSSTTRAKTCHWEGGKGCRNKTMMSKGDDRKFKNTRKTVSRKSQAKATPGKSK